MRELWRDWVHLLAIGVETGQMMTMDDLTPTTYRAAMASRDDRHWVYHRAGPAVPGVRHRDRARGDAAPASSTGAPPARPEPSELR